MDSRKVDLVLQFALAIAGERDSVRDGGWVGREQELGPIHLVKYVYIADLAHAAEHNGQTFTGANWHFHHYGPWEPDVWKRIEPALNAIEAQERHFSSRYKDDAVRWSVRTEGLVEELERKLPFEVASAVRQAVQNYGGETAPLLHSVYSTPPMLQAAPGEKLAMGAAAEVRSASVPVAAPGLKQLSKTHLVKLKKRARERIEEIKRREAEDPPLVPSPPYDAVFFAGRDWLDSLAGDGIEEHEGELFFEESVWKSAARRDPKLP